MGRLTGRGHSAILVAASVALLTMAACGSPPAPSPPEPVREGPVAAHVACWSVALPACERIAAEARSAAPEEVRPVILVEVRDGLVAVEGPNGRGRASAPFATAGDGRLEWGAWTVAAVGPVRAGSGPAPGPVVPLTLGHCGLDSPIDVDGALWDPIGAIPADPAMINATAGTFRRLGPDSADFVVGGTRVELRRHEGARMLPGCD